MDQGAVITVVLGIIVPILVAVLGAYDWQPLAAVWIKFGFALIAAVAVMFFMGSLVGIKPPTLTDPITFLSFLGSFVSEIFTLAVLVFTLINEKIKTFVRVKIRGLSL